MPIMTAADAEPKLEALRGHLLEFGRDPAKFGLEGWLRMQEAKPDLWAAAAEGWRKLGAQIVMLYPMFRVATFDSHIDMLRKFKEVAGG